MTSDIWEDAVSRVAAAVAADYPEVDPSDLRPLLEGVTSMIREISINPDAPGVVEALVVVADRYASNIRTEALTTSVQYHYRRSDVVQILETVYSEKTNWLNGWVPADAKSIKASVDSLDLHCDVSWGISRLHSVDQYRLQELYQGGDTLYPEAVDRALDNLLDLLNNYRGTGRASHS